MSNPVWACIECARVYRDDGGAVSVRCTDCGERCEAVSRTVHLPSPDDREQWDDYWRRRRHTISTTDTVFPRYMAATLDNFLAMILGVVAAKSIDEDQHALQLVLFVCAYLGYFFVFEAAISRTIGKAVMGLVVVRQDGSRASIRESAIRTLMRILEVNPAVFGAIPAAISIARSEHHQRFGDRMAGTVVIPRNRIPSSH